MITLDTVVAMQQACAEARRSGLLGLVPTMGALHAGHLSLVRAARAQCATVAASIFVNPTQFGPTEDFTRYPRTLAKDLALLEGEGVDLVFAPAVEEIYPPGAGETFVDPGEMGNRLDGRSRPGHFRGVCTVVTKLFHIAGPDLAFFGQKDAAQVAILRTMARDLNFPVNVVVCPTVREPDGLAMSSRNRYLSAEERQQALALSRALRAGEQAWQAGVHDAHTIEQTVRNVLRAETGVVVEYAEVVDPDTLLPTTFGCDSALLAIAAKVGSTRLIDNAVLERSR